MSELHIENLTVTFKGGIKAIDDLTLHVDDQEFVFLLGPSGAGKTTTLRTVAGLERPTAGRIRLGGLDTSGLAPRARNIAMVYDKHSLYPHLNVFENMAYPLRLRKMSDADMKKRIQSTAEILDIQDLLQRRPTELSGGQQQRVAIGRALVREASIYLMDEPISHLDAKLRAHMRVEFKKLQQEFASTILYVSHDQLEAMTMGDRIVVLNEGRVQQIGTPRDVFERPANLFVAEFVGEPSMNTLPCKLVQDGDKWTAMGSSFSVELDRGWVESNQIGNSTSRSLVIGFRPHRIELAAASEAGQKNVETGVLYAQETLGSETIYDIEIGNEMIRVWSRRSSYQQNQRRAGEPIHFRIDPDAVYLFDAKTGVTLAHAGQKYQQAA